MKRFISLLITFLSLANGFSQAKKSIYFQPEIIGNCGNGYYSNGRFDYTLATTNFRWGFYPTVVAVSNSYKSKIHRFSLNLGFRFIRALDTLNNDFISLKFRKYGHLMVPTNEFIEEFNKSYNGKLNIPAYNYSFIESTELLLGYKKKLYLKNKFSLFGSIELGLSRVLTESVIFEGDMQKDVIRSDVHLIKSIVPVAAFAIEAKYLNLTFRTEFHQQTKFNSLTAVSSLNLGLGYVIKLTK